MKITKFGHCCLLIEINGRRIVTDPGIYSTQQERTKGIDFILITHAHQDHFHPESVKNILKNNPNAEIITNQTVGKLLQQENISPYLLDHGQNITKNGITIEAFGHDHACLHSSLPRVQNTGYLVAERLFFPGDAFTVIHKPVEILALPVAGPWMKLPEAIDYVLEIQPKMCFPVHDSILKQPGSVYRIPPQVLEPKGITFMIPEIDKEYDLG